MANVLELLAARHTTRSYKNEKLTAEQLDALLKAGLQAPTARNSQELHFTAIDTDTDIVKELAHDQNPTAAVPFHYGASTLILISGGENFGWTGVDAGIAVQNIHLAASELGLGSVIIGCIAKVMRGEKKAYYAEKFAFPEGYDFQIAIAVGVQDAGKAPHEYNYEKDVTVL